MKISSTTLVLLFTFYLHGVGIFLFVRGFLLSRLSLSNVSNTDVLELPEPTHRRAIILIIDALRFDFISPVFPEPKSPYHHGVLTLPAELTRLHPDKSFIYLAYSDPPTTTLQRIKGITTGSLPTFVEMGANFGGSEIEEDSIIRQLRRHSKKIAFMGDDTWQTVFSKSFDPNMTHPFDSFNVEDLHTVDEGVIDNLFPLLSDKRKHEWDFIIGHFLGVDHVGHRLGPSHPTMKTKLEQMDGVLRRVVEALEDDTLLVLLGDHGMDLKGDHGGDSVHETSSGLWIYSKGVPLSAPSASTKVPQLLRTNFLFPGMPSPSRLIQQIDLVPTLSLLLGLPIPFNNLGAVIPELFIRNGDSGGLLSKALRINAKQIHDYLQAYRSSPSGGELNLYWAELSSSFREAAGSDEAVISYMRNALEMCRTLWAQFDSVLMILGLTVLLGSIVWSGLLIDSGGQDLQPFVTNGTRGLIIGGSVGVFVGLVSPTLSGPRLLYCILWCSAAGIILTPTIRLTKFKFSFSYSLIILSLHTISFFSNSFVFWEDKIIPFLLVSTIAPQIFKGIASPEKRARWRIVGYSLLALVAVRLMSISTVCREEQQPYCHVTFYASSTVAAPPIFMIVCALLSAILLPNVMRRFLRISKSDSGPSVPFLETLIRLVLLGGTVCWILEYCETTSFFGDDVIGMLRQARTNITRVVFGGTIFGGGYVWYRMGLCLKVIENLKEGKREVQVFGFANSFGSTYLLFVSLVFSIVWATSQLTGQVILALGMVALLSWLEIVDSLRDIAEFRLKFSPSAAGPKPRSIQLFEIIPIALLGLQMFYGTGHQSTLQSIQWKSAFLLTERLVYPFSPVLVALNAFGPILLVATFLPLVAMWNTEPLPLPGQSSLVSQNALVAVMWIMVYYICLLVGSAASAAWLRRHLMVWKVFAPRFMAGAAGIVVLDIGVGVAMFFGVPTVISKVSRTFGKK